MKAFDALDLLRAKWTGVGAAAAGAAAAERAAVTGGAMGAVGAAGGVTSAEAAAGGAVAGRALRGGGTLRPSGLILPAGVSGVGTEAAAAAGGAGLLSRGVGAAAGLAGRFLLPVAGFEALLGAIGSQGNVLQRAQSGLSAASFGIIPAPVTTAQRQAQGQAAAAADIAKLNNGNSIAAQRQAVTTLQRRIQSIRGVGSQLPSDLRGAAQQQVSPSLKAATAALRDELRRREALLRDSQRAVDQQLDAQSIRHAQALSTDFAGAFQILTRARGPRAAMKQTVGNVLHEMSQMRPAGAKQLGDTMIGWAREQARQNPKLRGQVQRLIGGIKSDFSDLHKHVTIVNGQIYDGSKDEWSKIAGELSTQTERAREEVSKHFTAIQQEAIGSLTSMGFTSAQARQLVRTGGSTLSAAASLASSSNAGVHQAGLNVPQAVAYKGKHATGGRTGVYRLPGSGTLDTVALADGGLGAPGELVINHWDERQIDLDLARAGRPTLEQRVRQQTKPHWRRATGGRVVTASTFGGPGDPGTGSTGYRGDNLNQHPDSFAELNMGTALGNLPYMTPVTVGANGQAMTLYKRDIGKGGAGLNGHVRAVDLWWQAAQKLHVNGLQDVLVTIGKGGAAFGGGGAGNVAGGGSIPALRAPASAVPGVPGVMSHRAGQIFAGGLTQRINRALASMAPAFSASVAGGGATSGPPGLATFGGVTMAKWIADELQWATAHGWHGQPTSGYRPGFDPHTASGQSEHALINYPGGAVDFGGFTDPAAYQTKLALVQLAARLNYPGPRLKMPVGFHDDGHLSGSGHTLGGRLGGPVWGGWHAKGTDVVVRRPTVFGAGEAGPERVKISPHGGGGSSITIARGAVQVNSAGGDPRATERYVTRRLQQFAEEVAAEIEGGAEQPLTGALR
jgi:hypothetical protein